MCGNQINNTIFVKIVIDFPDNYRFDPQFLNLSLKSEKTCTHPKKTVRNGIVAPSNKLHRIRICTNVFGFERGQNWTLFTNKVLGIRTSPPCRSASCRQQKKSRSKIEKKMLLDKPHLLIKLVVLFLGSNKQYLINVDVDMFVFSCF